jgi:hypothetical protein
VYATIGTSTPAVLPAGWSGGVQRSDGPALFAPLGRGEQARYRLHVQPADPGTEKPGVLRPLELLAWMDEGDSWIPAQRLSLPVLLSHATEISLSAKRVDAQRVTVNGQLRWLNLDHQPKPVIGAPLVVSLDCGNGQRRLWLPGQADHSARSNPQGQFSQTLVVSASAHCLAQAHYAGSVMYAASRSPTLAIAASGRSGLIAPWKPPPGRLPGTERTTP